MTESDPQDSEVYGDYSVDDEDQPQGEGDSLSDARGLHEPLDEGYSPPEKWSAASPKELPSSCIARYPPAAMPADATSPRKTP